MAVVENPYFAPALVVSAFAVLFVIPTSIGLSLVNVLQFVGSIGGLVYVVERINETWDPDDSRGGSSAKEEA